jgi:hypothetical protein
MINLKGLVTMTSALSDHLDDVSIYKYIHLKSDSET